MRILIDTNIFIYREDYKVLSLNIQNLVKILYQVKASILIHPGSIEDIKRDTDENRKIIVLSKIGAYPLLESPPNPVKDEEFLNAVGNPSKINDEIDNSILYAIYKDAADFLITSDHNIHQKSKRLGIKDRVLSVDEAIEIFGNRVYTNNISHLPALRDEFVYNLDLNDQFFDSLKEEYGENNFENWFKRISREGRKCFVHLKENGKLGALLIYKVECEPIDSTPPLFKKKRLKLSTFKVSHIGNIIGELFIKLAVDYSIKNKINEIYLTHFIKPSDFLVDLISEYGFENVSTLNQSGEKVFLKKLVYESKTEYINANEMSKKYYPSYCDGKNVNKFIVPILPEWHKKLFTEYKSKQKKGRQPTLDEFAGRFIIEGNAIKKAYVCHSNIKKISSGDIILFYRSQDESAVTSLGVVEKALNGIQNKEEIIRYIAKRSVYPIAEIEYFAKKPVLVILFTWHFHLPNPLGLEELKEIGILKAAPQSITQITHEEYLLLRKRGLIDERFTVN